MILRKRAKRRQERAEIKRRGRREGLLGQVDVKYYKEI